MKSIFQYFCGDSFEFSIYYKDSLITIPTSKSFATVFLLFFDIHLILHEQSDIHMHVFIYVF